MTSKSSTRSLILFRSLSHRSFALLWCAQTISRLGDSLYSITLEGPLEAVMPLLVRQHLHQGVAGYALLQALESAGAIGAAVALGSVTRIRHRGPLIYGAWLLACLAMVVFGLPIPFTLAGVAAAVTGAGIASLGLVWLNTLQERISGDQLGRVSSVDVLGSSALSSVGFGLAGLAADHIGAARVFLVGGLASAALIALGLLSRSVRNLD